MSTTQRKEDVLSIAEIYEQDGYFLPFELLTTMEAKELRDEIEAAELELQDDPEKLSLFIKYTDRLLPSVDRLIRNENLLEAVSTIMGPNLHVWNAGLFIKEAKSKKIISWHQDLTYWGLSDAQEITCWLALSPATKESGCMKFVPRSHKSNIVEHVDTVNENNLLSRGQELAVEVDEDDAIYAELQPGQMSFHHGHLFHASEENTSDYRRIGLAIRFIRTDMKQEDGDETLVAHVKGEDAFNHFKVAGPPKGRLSEEDFALCRADREIKQKLLY